MPPTSRTPFRLTTFSAFSENSTFDFLIRFCFNRFGVPLVSNPSLRVFLHTICQRFHQTSEPCPNPLDFLLFNGQWREEAGGWGGWGVGEDLSLNTDFFTDKTRPKYTSQPFTLHCNKKKSSFTLLEITIGQDKIYGWSAQWVPYTTIRVVPINQL